MRTPVVLLLVIGAAGAGEPAAAQRTLARAAGYLWSRQAEDGGWHSDTYGLLRSGQALTPFVLDALLDVPGPRPEGAVDRALAFLRAQIGDGDMLGFSVDGLLEYPTYATAYAIRCFERAGESRDVPLIERMRRRLLSEQYRCDGPADGGWGFGGRRPGHMDLAHTRRVLQAVPVAGEARERALAFLARVQNDDGGFYLSPVVLDANKTRDLASYATATCDGALALLAAGVPRDDPRVEAAARWLAEHDDTAIPADGVIRWDLAVRYYHIAVRGEAHAALGLPPPRVVLEPRPDGSFANAHHLMKEDDPLIATAHVVKSLAAGLNRTDRRSAGRIVGAWPSATR